MTPNGEAPAFPKPYMGSNGQGCAGLTKREYFAAMAMAGMLVPGTQVHGPWVAERAVEMADALITELEKTT